MNVQVSAPAGFALMPGDPLPRMCPPTQSRPLFAVDSAAGRYLVLCFYGSMTDPRGRAAVEAAQRRRDLFDGHRAWFFGVSLDPGDAAEARVKDAEPGLTFLWDFDGWVSASCGALTKAGGADGPGQASPLWLVVDPTLHVLAVLPFGPEPEDHDGLFRYLDRLPPPGRFAGYEMPIPVLLLPNVFDPGLCRHLIGLYDAHGGGESGVIRDNKGVFDRSFKSRKDFTIEDAKLIGHIQGIIKRRVLPEIERLFFMKITRMERYMVGCYSAEDGGHFRPHRDNGTGITEHRRFAVSINLNGDFDGGEVNFPEYSPRGIKAPPGWCVVFPAAILHAVSRVGRGRRYAFLPFVYDEGGAAIRQANLQKMAAQQARVEQVAAAEEIEATPPAG